MRLTTSWLDRMVAKEVLMGDDLAYSMTGTPGAWQQTGATEGDAARSMLEDYVKQITDAEMRDYREGNMWAGAAVAMRVDQVRNAQLDVVPEDSTRQWSDPEQTVAREILDFLQAPNLELVDNTFGGWIGQCIEDMLVINRGAVQVLWNADGTVRALRPLDGSRLKPNKKWRLDANGNAPLSTPRWYYVKPGVNITSAEDLNNPAKATPLMHDEVMVFQVNSLTYEEAGLSPMRALRRVLIAELDVFRKMHQAIKFGTPPGIFVVPGAPPGTAGKLKLLYETKLMGKPSVGFMNLPQGSKFESFGAVDQLGPGAEFFYKIQVFATAAAFRTSPFHLGWVETVNRANSETQVDITDDGIISLLKFLRQVFQQRIVARWPGATNHRLTFLELEHEEEPEDAASVRTKAGVINFLSINDSREADGKERITEQDVGPLLFPFYDQIWVPSAIAGTLLPVVYAAATFGLHTDEGSAMINAGQQRSLPNPDAGQPPTEPVDAPAQKMADTRRLAGDDDIERGQDAMREVVTLLNDFYDNWREGGE